LVFGFFIKITLTGNATSIPCDDRDGGLNPFVASYVFTDWSDGYNPYMDECINSTSLKEAVCDNGPKFRIVRCKKGCVSNHCLDESLNEIYISGQQTNFSWDCKNNSYYASDVLREIEEQYNAEGEKLLNQTSYKGLPIIVKDVLISGYTGENVTGRMIDTDPYGCDVYNPNTNPCISPIIEIGRIKFYSLFELKPWAHPRILSDGSSVAPLSEDFFLNMGEVTRWVLEHEFTHTIYYHRFTNETIGQYEDRVSSVATQNLFNYRVNCTQIKYLDTQTNKYKVYPSEDFIIQPNQNYTIICSPNMRLNVNDFVFVPSCISNKTMGGGLPENPPTIPNQTAINPNRSLNPSLQNNQTNLENEIDNNSANMEDTVISTNQSLRDNKTTKIASNNQKTNETFIEKLISWLQKLFG